MCDISKDFLVVSLIPHRDSPEEVCLPSYDILICWLNLAASCLDDENELPLKLIVSFSALCFALPSIPLMFLHGLVTSAFWSNVSHCFSFCVSRYGSGCHKSVLAVQAWWGLFYEGNLVTSSISAGTGSSWSLYCHVAMWCDAALSRTVRKIFPYLWQSVGKEHLLRATSTSGLYSSQLAFLRLT